MKTKIAMIVSSVLAIVMLSCSADYKKTPSGVVYKIFPGGSKDSAAGQGNVLKYNSVYKVDASVLYVNHGKILEFFAISPHFI